MSKLKYKRKAEDRGLPTEEQRVEDLIADKLWTDQNERDIKSGREFISKMEDTKKKMALKSERKRVQESIDQEINKLNKDLESFKKTIEESNTLYESMLDKTTQSLEKILSNTESISKIQ